MLKVFRAACLFSGIACIAFGALAQNFWVAVAGLLAIAVCLVTGD